MTKVIVAFRNIAKGPEICMFLYDRNLIRILRQIGRSVCNMQGCSLILRHKIDRQKEKDFNMVNNVAAICLRVFLLHLRK